MFELEYHLDVGVASDCPSVGAMTVTKPTLCANVSIIGHAWIRFALYMYPWCYLSKSHVSVL